MARWEETSCGGRGGGARSARSEAILEAAGDGIVGVGTDHRIEFANKAAHDLLAASRGRLVGRDFGELLGDAEGDDEGTGEMSVYLSPAAASRRRRRVDGVMLRRTDGTTFPAEIVATPRHDGEAEVGTVFAFRDITERLRNETARRTSEMRLRAIFDHAALGIAVLDADGRIVDANRSLSHTLQLPAAALMHCDASTFVSPEEAGAVTDALLRVREGSARAQQWC
ncbi:MAG: PAS domain S-box protein [Gemmatimonadetes bacterium]|nr:PAS domain S-box protein [Gemmatimonadota bacterium]